MRNLVLALALAGCAHTGPAATGKADGPNAADYYPLAVGNSWTFDVNLLGEKSTKEMKVLRQEGGFLIDNTGARLAADAYGVRDGKRYLLRNPVEAGTTWTNVVSVSVVEHYEILAANQPCDSPAGQFEGCVVIQSSNNMGQGRVLLMEMTLAPHVGIVRLSTTLDNKGQRIPQSEFRLASYSLQKGEGAARLEAAPVAH
jgi:hypothetical protein